MKNNKSLMISVAVIVFIVAACILAACSGDDVVPTEYKLVGGSGVYLSESDFYNGVYIQSSGGSDAKIALNAQNVKVEGYNPGINGTQTLTVTYGAFSDTVKVFLAFRPYTVTYAAGKGGSIEGDTRQSVSYGGDSTPVRAVADEGYVFANWSDGVTTVERNHRNVGADPDAVLSVWASFLKVRYDVVVKSADGSENQTMKIAYGSTIGKLPVPAEQEGKNFLYYVDDNGSTVTEETVVKGNMTVTPVYETKKVRVIFYTRNASNALVEYRTFELDYGDYFTDDIPEGEDRPGKTFASWKLKGQISAPDFSKPITADVEVEPSYNNVVYTVTFDAKNGGVTDVISVKHGSLISRPADPYKDGFDFLGWYEDGQVESFDFDNVYVTRNTNLSAVWREIQKVRYTLTIYTAKDGEIARTELYDEGAYLGTVDPLPDTAEFYFSGYVDEDGREVLAGHVMSADYAIYATWSNVKYKVNFKLNTVSDWTPTPLSPIEVNYGKTISPAEFPDLTGDERYVSEKYVFDYWTLNGERVTEPVTITSSVTLNAVWKLRRYTISFVTTGEYGISTSLGEDNVESFEYYDRPTITITLLPGIEFVKLLKVVGNKSENITCSKTKGADGIMTITFQSKPITADYSVQLNVNYITHTIEFNRVVKVLPFGEGIDALYVLPSSTGVLAQYANASVTVENKHDFQIEVYDTADVRFGLVITKGYKLNDILINDESVTFANGSFVVQNVTADVSVDVLTSAETYSLYWNFVNGSYGTVSPGFKVLASVNNGSMTETHNLNVSFGKKVTFALQQAQYVAELKNNYYVEINGKAYEWSDFGSDVNENGGFSWTYSGISRNTTIYFIRKN